MKKRISVFLRKVAAKKEIHYLMMLIGTMIVFAGADAILKGDYLTAAFMIITGTGATLHAVWFLGEILDAFQ